MTKICVSSDTLHFLCLQNSGIMSGFELSDLNIQSVKKRRIGIPDLRRQVKSVNEKKTLFAQNYGVYFCHSKRNFSLGLYDVDILSYLRLHN